MPDTAIIYGDSGSGKTSICVSMAKWMYETTGLTTRLISVDGWAPVENEGLISAGIVAAYNPSVSPKFLATTRKLTRGYWPKIVKRMHPVLDEQGIQTGEVMKSVRETVEDKEEFNKVGLYFIETSDGISDAYMNFIKDEEIMEEDERGRLRVKAIGPQGTAGRYEQDGEVLGSNSEGHYNVVQVEMHSLFRKFGSLGGNVKLVMWTAHVGMGKIGNTKATDSKGRKKLVGDPCYCPLLVGEAKNAMVPSWVGECFHLEDFPLIMDEHGRVSQQKQVRAYYENHRETGIMEGPQYRAKSRVGLSDVEALHEQFPGGYISLGVGPTEGLDQYYRWLATRKGGNKDNVRNWKEELDKLRKAKM